MEERDRVVWLHRSGGFGLPMAQMQTAVAAGADAELSRLLDVAGAGGAPAMDPWDDSLLPLDPMDREARIHAVGGWLRLMIETEQPVLDHMAWWWHGHLVSGLDKVRFARAMVEQIRLFRRDGLGNFPALLRSITLDPAMLLYLDLHTSTGSQPNENYARELLELFALGVGVHGSRREGGGHWRSPGGCCAGTARWTSRHCSTTTTRSSSSVPRACTTWTPCWPR
ncbi:MAG: DUF1800 family protein [Ilumatobacteraceae bacterium]